MIKPNYKYLAFDDRMLLLFGIPFITILLPFLFFGMTFEEIKMYGFRKFYTTGIFTTTFWLFSRFLMIQFRKKYPLLEDYTKRIQLQAIVYLFSVPLISTSLGSFIDIILHLCSIDSIGDPGLIRGSLATYFLIFTVSALYETIYFIHKYRETLMEKNQLQLAHVQGQLENLRNQINPHFLFNSLNTLMSLIPVDSDRAMDYLSKLSKFYRYAVSSQKEPLIDVQTEIANAELYGDLLKERFYNAIDIQFQTDHIPDAHILPLSLQLLIENSIKHNIVSQAKPLTVQVCINLEKQYIFVRNNIQRKIEEVSSTGMGLNNIKERIAYFSEHPVIVEDNDESFTVGIPLISKS